MSGPLPTKHRRRQLVLDALSEPLTVQEVIERTGLPGAHVNAWIGTFNAQGLIRRAEAGTWVAAGTSVTMADNTKPE